jgi:hypothetical protein
VKKIGRSVPFLIRMPASVATDVTSPEGAVAEEQATAAVRTGRRRRREGVVMEYIGFDEPNHTTSRLVTKRFATGSFWRAGASVDS